MNYDDIYGIWQPAQNNSWWLALMLITVIITVIGALLFFLYRRYTYYRQPWVIAEQELKLLYKKASGDYKKFYQELMRILKHYISARYNNTIYDKTEHEFLEYLKSVIPEENILEETALVITNAYRVKFGDVTIQEIAADMVAKDVERAVSLVVSTIPQI